MAMPLQRRTSGPPDSSSKAIRQFLVMACEQFGRQLTEALIKIWEKDLAGLPVDRLPEALETVRKNSRFFPQPADVNALFQDLEKGAFTLKAEASWQNLLDWVRLHYHPDLGIDRYAPQLDATTWHAARAAGGIRLLYSCASEDLVWRKKEFITHYTTVHETGKAEYLLTQGESKKLLAEIRNGGPSVPVKLLKEDARRVEFSHERPNPAPVRKEFAPKSANEQLAEMKTRGWIK
jgi:hypothetical protein